MYFLPAEAFLLAEDFVGVRTFVLYKVFRSDSSPPVAVPLPLKILIRFVVQPETWHGSFSGLKAMAWARSVDVGQEGASLPCERGSVLDPFCSFLTVGVDFRAAV